MRGTAITQFFPLRPTTARPSGFIREQEVLPEPPLEPHPDFRPNGGGSGALDILETFIFNDETAGIQLGISQLDTGIVLSSYDGDWVWQTIPLGEALASLEELPISIDASFFKGLSVMKQGSQATSDEEAWIFISTVIGNYRIAVPMTAGGFDDAGFNDPLKILGDFVTGNEDLEDRVILNIDNNSNQFLYVGTDSGLYKIDSD